MSTKKEKREPREPVSIEVAESVVFDGVSFAREREKIIKTKVQELGSLGVTPKLVVILTSKDEASKLYVRLKEKACERVGIEVEVYHATTATRDYHYVLNLLGVFNRDPSIHGIMIQMPLGERYVPYTEKILENISPNKDVDGLRKDSIFMPATVRAVLSIIEFAKRAVIIKQNPHILVVGASGMVGSGLLRALKKLGASVEGYDKKKGTQKKKWREVWGVPSFLTMKADILISATGFQGLISAKQVRSGAVLIDVGSPRGDIRFKEVLPKSSFITPVPGGVGPVTVVSLLENVIQAAYNSLNTHSVGDSS